MKAKRLADRVRDLEGKVVGIPRFGISAPGNTVMDILGMNSKTVVAAAKSYAA